MNHFGFAQLSTKVSAPLLGVCIRAVLLALALSPWFSAPGFAQPLYDRPQNPLAGSRVFGEKGCSKCHAINGVGGKIGPDLARLPGARSFDDLATALWNHLPTMTDQMRELDISRPLLTPQETADLIAFLFLFNYFDAPGDIQEGHRLFTTKKCVTCHRVGGVGGTVGPALDNVSQYGAPLFIAAAMWNHGPDMAAAMRARGIQRPTLSKQELLDLIAYLRSTTPAPQEETIHILVGSARRGRELFSEKECLTCHQINGQGGRIGPDLAGADIRGGLIELAALMWNKAPKMTQAMEQRRIPVPRLEAGEMADIVAYLYSVKYFATSGNPNRGRNLVEAKGCLACHSLHGRGGSVARDLATVKGFDSMAPIIAALWNHVAVSQANRRRIVWPRFAPKEMQDLVAFLLEAGRSR